MTKYDECSWAEYDSAAEYLAKRGLTGKAGDPLPALLSTACLEAINEDEEAFQERVRKTAYALAMELALEQSTAQRWPDRLPDWFRAQCEDLLAANTAMAEKLNRLRDLCEHVRADHLIANPASQFPEDGLLAVKRIELILGSWGLPTK